jgi:D-amino-acid oxidase
MARISIVGSGVVGLTCAYELADLDVEVTVFHDKPLLDTTSSTATAVWHVYLVDPNDQTHLDWSARTLSKLLELHDHVPEAAVELPAGVELFRVSDPSRPQWADVAIGFEPLSSEDLTNYPGRTWGYRVKAPATNMRRYLPWLRRSCQERGVMFIEQHLTDLNSLFLDADIVVNCAGLGAGRLVNDLELYPMKGQYLIFDQPERALDFYIGDDEHPDGMAYVIPRDGQILIGGTAEPGVWSTDFTQDVQGLIRRALQFCPDLGLESHALVDKVVGLRPCRLSGRVRFGADSDNHRLLHNYGHGGSGFSLSWGCAQDICRLAADLLRASLD